MTSVRRVRRKLLRLYRRRDVRLWLDSPHRLLNRQRPLDLLIAGRAQAVEEVVDRTIKGERNFRVIGAATLALLWAAILMLYGREFGVF